MKLFRSRFERELDDLADAIKINLSNNYKSTAHLARIKLGERCEQLFTDGLINKKTYLHYKAVYDTYTEMLKDYHH